MQQFKIRASQVFKIMTEPRTKKELLSETCKSYLQEWILEQKGFTKEIKNKYLEKGLLVEQDSIDLLSKYKKLFLRKNEQSFENEYITGTPDVITEKTIYEIKSSWNLFTFPFFDREPTKAYWWQCQAYMELLNIDNTELCFCLINTPEHIINNEISKLKYEFGFRNEEAEKEIRNNHDFDRLSINDKVKIFIIKKDLKAIELIKNRVEECREYLNSIKMV